MTNWLKFTVQQIESLIVTIAGWFVLIPFCLLRAWRSTATSIDPDYRAIDVWSWDWLNGVYGNPEDGVSGAQAIVNGQPYMPTANSIWRAYCWSAWRNSANGLKYRFAAPAPD